MVTQIESSIQQPKPFRWGHIPLHIVLIIGAIIMVMPFLWVVRTSLKTQADVLKEFPPRLIPSTLMFSNYSTALTSLPFGRFDINSLFVSGSVTIVQLFTSSLAAIAAGAQG